MNRSQDSFPEPGESRHKSLPASCPYLVLLESPIIEHIAQQGSTQAGSAEDRPRSLRASWLSSGRPPTQSTRNHLVPARVWYSTRRWLYWLDLHDHLVVLVLLGHQHLVPLEGDQVFTARSLVSMHLVLPGTSPGRPPTVPGPGPS